jgi:hypothetical protein
MPAVGIILFLIGIWLVIRTLRGNLAETITRTLPTPTTSS